MHPTTALGVLVLAAVTAVATVATVADAGLAFAPVVRRAFASDVTADWELVSNETDVCPDVITHTTWKEGEGSVITLPHNTIKHDGDRCDGTNGKFIMYPNAMLTDLDAVDDKVPKELVGVLQSVGVNVNIKFALDQYGEEYYIGFEASSRFCGKTKFEALTTAFLVRPFGAPLTIKDVEPELVAEFKYVIMVPKFQGSACVYRTEVPKSAETESDANAEASAEAESESCFPADSTVELSDGRTIRMEALRIGDAVRVDARTFSPVFMFTHRLRDVTRTFLKLHTPAATLTLTPGHYLYVNGALATAATVRPGDRLRLGDGSAATVRAVEAVAAKGLYNPQTLHGDVVVDGVAASTYTSAVEPVAAHALLTPVRGMFAALGWSSDLFDNGRPAVF